MPTLPPEGAEQTLLALGVEKITTEIVRNVVGEPAHIEAALPEDRALFSEIWVYVWVEKKGFLTLLFDQEQLVAFLRSELQPDGKHKTSTGTLVDNPAEVLLLLAERRQEEKHKAVTSPPAESNQSQLSPSPIPVSPPPAPVQISSQKVSSQGVLERWTEQHYLREKLSRGAYLILEDDTVWEVKRFNRFESRLWMRRSSLVVKCTLYQGLLFGNIVNLDTGEEVEAKKLGKVILRDTIKGEFQGWDGDTVFALSTGNVLQQVSYSYTYHYAFMPEVILIDRGGFYSMLVDDLEELVDVVVLK